MSQNSSTDATKSEKQKAIPEKKFFDVAFYHDWCKACGICMAFCPQKIIRPDRNGNPVVTEPDNCIGCRFCEMHCPDFAITVGPRQPKRRKDDF